MSSRNPIFSGLKLDFLNPNTGRDITQTFSLLLTVIGLFAIIMGIWAAGASVMRAAYLSYHESSPWGQECWLLKAATVVFWQIVRGVGGTGAICMAAGFVGAILGFLFGIPRPVSAAETPPAGAGTTSTSAALRRGKLWESSTNLTQISDWLTKIIVGVGLVEANKIAANFVDLVNTSASWLFEMRHGSPIVLGAGMLTAGSIGFLFCYLYTELVIARLIANADANLGTILDEAAARPIADMAGYNEALGPRISLIGITSDMPFGPSDEMPTAKQVEAALQLAEINLDDLNTPSEVKLWARARALLNDYKPAARGYARLLGMKDDSQPESDPGVLIEAARVFRAAGRRSEAALMATVALGVLREMPPEQKLSLSDEIKGAIVGDNVALLLENEVNVRGSYKKAVNILSEFMPKDGRDLDGKGRLKLYRALANGMGLEAEELLPSDQANIESGMEADIRAVLGKPGKEKENLDDIDKVLNNLSSLGISTRRFQIIFNRILGVAPKPVSPPVVAPTPSPAPVSPPVVAPTPSPAPVSPPVVAPTPSPAPVSPPVVAPTPSPVPSPSP